ncbi:MAG TPA: ABC transporter ATP-binding protein [Labilithrix sp.]|nr:ABC transporter ATP-binding protein [Labilithrix sp.]
MNAFVTLSGITKTYQTARATTEVLGGVDLTLARGEFVAIVGYSGSGKTTLLSILAGLVRPDAGEVRIAGKLVTGPGLDRGVVFQNYSLLPWLSVRANVQVAVDRAFSSMSREARAARVDAYVAMVGLSPAANKKPSELSGGMRQRVAVARALATEPDVLLMDEPFGALDALTRATLQDELARICRETARTTVLVTNDIDEALLLADRIVPLGHGPAAVLGPSIEVAAARPRDRRALNRDPILCQARVRVLDYLLRSGGRRRALPSGERPAVLPPLDRSGELPVTSEPEDACA